MIAIIATAVLVFPIASLLSFVPTYIAPACCMSLYIILFSLSLISFHDTQKIKTIFLFT